MQWNDHPACVSLQVAAGAVYWEYNRSAAASEVKKEQERKRHEQLVQAAEVQRKVPVFPMPSVHHLHVQLPLPADRCKAALYRPLCCMQLLHVQNQEQFTALAAIADRVERLEKAAAENEGRKSFWRRNTSSTVAEHLNSDS